MNMFKKAIKKVKELEAALSYQAPTTEGHQPTIPIDSQPPNVGSGVQSNKTMSALKLYFTLDDLNTYIRNHTDEAHKNHTFIPVKVDFNEHSMEFEICLLSADPIEPDGRRYRVNLNQLSEDDVLQHNTEPCRDCAYGLLDAPQCKHCNAGNNYEYFRRW